MTVKFLTCDEFNTSQDAQTLALKAYTDSKVASAGVDPATSTTYGTVKFHSGDPTQPAATNLALTAGAFNVLANDSSVAAGNVLQQAIGNAVQQVVAGDTGLSGAIATAIGADAAASTALVTGITSELVTALGATVAETVTGTEAAKFVTPASLLGTLNSGQQYLMNIRFTGVSDPYDTARFVRDGTADGAAVVAISTSSVANNHAIVANRKATQTGSAIAAVRTISSDNSKTYYAHLGYSEALIRAAVYGDSNLMVDTPTDIYYAGYFKGNVYYSAALTSSDARMKENIRPAEGIDLPIYTFDKYASKTKRDHKIGTMCGVLAQEVQAVAPDYVKDNGDHLTIAESSVIFALIAGLQKKLAEQESLIAGLQQDIERLSK